MRRASSLGAFKRQSKAEFLKGYELFKCVVNNCFVCGNEGGSQREAALLEPQEISEIGE